VLSSQHAPIRWFLIALSERRFVTVVVCASDISERIIADYHEDASDRTPGHQARRCSIGKSPTDRYILRRAPSILDCIS